MDSALEFNIFNSIIFAGIFQGMVFSLVVIFSKKYRSKNILFLTILIFSFSFNNLGYYLMDIALISKVAFFKWWYLPSALLSPPLFYSYIECFLNPEKKFSSREKLLFSPFLFALLISFLYKIAAFANYKNDAFYDFIAPLPNLVEFLGILYTQIILVYCFVRLVRYEKNGLAPENQKISVGLNWLKWILGSLFLLSFLWAFEMVASVIDGVSKAFYMLWIGMSVMIYWLGHVGIYQFGVVEERRKIRTYSVENKIRYIPVKQKNEHIVQMENILVNQKRFLDPTITLDKIAEELKVSKSHLSRIFNAELQVSFPEYLNTLRVEEAKLYLRHPDFSNYTLIAIGLEAGFNSKTTFNNAFKKITGTTPSDFKKQLLS